MRPYRSLASVAPALALVAIAGCNDFLDVKPTTEVPGATAIVDERTARAAGRGVYDDLQSTDYYGGDFTIFMDLSGPDVIHSGTFTDYADADDNNLYPDNGGVAGMWQAMYSAIGRANSIIQRVPTVASVPAAVRDSVLADAYFVRALAYHDLVKTFGDTAAAGLGVPVRLTEPKTIEETFDVRRETTGAVYTQINADLDSAEKYVANTSDRHRVTATAVRALRARVRLYQKDWAGALAAARQVVTTPGYSLTPRFSDLFTPGISNTNENIFQLTFTPQDASNLGYYYLSKPLGGRREVAPARTFFNAFAANDQRKAVTVASYVNSSGTTVRYSPKFPSPAGDDDLHVIRLAEVILIKAEAHAHLGQLDSAAVEVNKVHTRAGLPAYAVPFPDLATALAAIMEERRFEFALEGQRWPDLVRTGQAAVDYGTQARYPIPQREIDVTKQGSLIQNPGY